MTDTKSSIECDKHGTSEMAYVCCHLANAEAHEAVGFYQSDVDVFEKTKDYNAWCSSCEEKLIKAGGEWNDLLEKQADIKVVCLSCFDDMKFKQMSLNPADMALTYIPENPDVDLFYNLADDHINLANSKKDHELQNKSESFSFAAARFAAFEATLQAKDLVKDKEKIIDYYILRFTEMFIDNLNDYIDNQDEYFENSKNNK